MGMLKQFPAPCVRSPGFSTWSNPETVRHGNLWSISELISMFLISHLPDIIFLIVIHACTYMCDVLCALECACMFMCTMGPKHDSI